MTTFAARGEMLDTAGTTRLSIGKLLIITGDYHYSWKVTIWNYSTGLYHNVNFVPLIAQDYIAYSLSLLKISGLIFASLHRNFGLSQKPCNVC